MNRKTAHTPSPKGERPAPETESSAPGAGPTDGDWPARERPAKDDAKEDDDYGGGLVACARQRAAA